MKHKILWTALAAFCFGSAGVFAANETPIVTKISATGANATNDLASGQRCDLFSDKMRVTLTYGLSDGTTTSVMQDVPLTLQKNFMDMVKEVANGKLDSQANDGCGFPTTTIALGDGTVIFDTGGCGKPHLFRDGGASRHIMELMAIYCSKTYN